MKLILPYIGNCDNAFVITVCITYCMYVSCQLFRRKEGSETDTDDFETLPEDHYSFVALIDIVFTNSAKKTCTGTIIHDNVVVTAAHCFYIKENDHSQPEMTASFVVIGTKKMFDTGYEQYLPIERIIIHPKYKGWTADLALVHTFAGMVSDKTGHIVPLATERISTPVDSTDIMVFSWGKCRDDSTKKSEEETYSKKEDDHRFRGGNKKPKQFRLKINRDKTRDDVPVSRARGRITRVRKAKKIESAMSSIEENNRYKYQQRQYENLTDFNSEVEQMSWENKLDKLNQLYKRAEVNKDRMLQRDRRRTSRVMSYYRNSGWRRKMGDQQNKLTIELFGFVNSHACQKLVQKAVPAYYRIQTRQEMLCYSSERRYITEDDAGAPAMRRGRLVAVTVGGVDFEGEHVAVGMKMVCFCNWIAENLPTGSKLKCCKNCCDTSDEEAEKKKNSRH